MKAVVLLSGGIDSTTALSMAVKEYGADEVMALTLYYGQKHERELLSAQNIADHFQVRHLVRDLSAVFEMSNSPLLKDRGPIPEGDYATQKREANGMVKTYVPYRNGLFLSYATAIAYSIGAQEIWYGAHADDAAGNAYPDCTEDFYLAQAAAIYYGTGEKVKMYAPFIKMTKPEIVKIGLDLDAPYHLTWSCYNGAGVACGKCGTCIDRKKAFEVNGVKDPIEYAEV